MKAAMLWAASAPVALVLVALVLVALAAPARSADPAKRSDFPAWAYPLSTPSPTGQGSTVPSTDPTPIRIPGSKLSFTTAQIRDSFNPPDWHPENHPPAPEIIMKGSGGIRPCGVCHLPNGLGRPANSSVAGLPESYIIQQMADFKNDKRMGSEPKMTPTALMRGIAKMVSEEQMLAAAKYFASLKPKPWVRVVETTTVPKTRVEGPTYVPIKDAPQEVLGLRIIEVPEDVRRAEVGDSESGFIAYVPPGSIARGEQIAVTGTLTKGNVVPCVVCHGADLRGLGPVPGLAGRSPTYLVRQLYDLQAGTRAGAWSPLMKDAVENMDIAEMVSVSAYAASRAP